MMKSVGNPNLENTLLYRWLKERNSGFLQGISEVAEIAKKQLAHQVPRIFPHYTQHDIGHSLRVLSYMADLIHDIDSLSEIEVAMLIHSALLHDIGMAIGDNGIQQLKENKLSCCSIKFQAMLKMRDGKEELAVQDIVRMVHADISADKIIKEFSKHMVVPDMAAIDFGNDVAAICQSHTRDPRWVLTELEQHNMKGASSYNPRYIAHVLRIADLLDFDSRRTPLCLYHLLTLQGISKAEWQKHFVITNTEKIKLDKSTGQKRVALFGECRDPHIHRRILKYIGWIEAELDTAIKSTEAMSPQYRLFFRDRVDNQIRTLGYSISDYKIKVDFKSITELLMGEHIYGDRRLGLRELVQNCIDACNVRKELDAAGKEYGDDEFKPHLQVIIDKQCNQILVRDNGCGMKESTIRNYFLNIGRSYYASEEYLLQDLRYKPIGTYGIGFLACFMLSDQVGVQTRQYESAERCDIEFEKGSEFISFARHKDSSFCGTEIRLLYSQFMEAFENKVENVVNFLNFYILTRDITLEVIDRATKATHKISQPLQPTKDPGKGEKEVTLSEYLLEVEGFARLRRSGVCVANITDLDVNENYLLLWDGSSLKKTDNLKLADALEGEQLRYFSIDVYSEDDLNDFDTLYNRFGDIEEIIDKFDRELQISLFVFADENYDFYWESHNTFADEDYEIVRGLTIAEILDKVGVKGFVPEVHVVEKNYLRHPDKDFYLPFHTPKGNMGAGWLATTSLTVFVRDVRIGSAELPQLCQPSIMKFNQITVNITHSSIYPFISRNLFDKATQNQLSYAITKAAISAWRNTFVDSQEEGEMIDLFLSRFYSDSHALVR